MLDVLQYEFMQNAILSAFLVCIATGIIGTLVVVNRMVFLAGGIAHSAYGGIGLSIFFSFPILLGTTFFSIVSAILIAYAVIYQKERIDTFIGILWAVGMAIGIVLIDLTPGYNVDLMSYLFGSILAVSKDDIFYMSILVAFILASVVILYDKFLAISYDPQFAKIRGININLYTIFLLILIALTIVMAIRVVGLILVIALLTIPVYIAEMLSNSLAKMMVLSALMSTLFSLCGLALAYLFDITSGAAIIMVSALSFLFFFMVKKLLK